MSWLFSPFFSSLGLEYVVCIPGVVYVYVGWDGSCGDRIGMCEEGNGMRKA